MVIALGLGGYFFWQNSQLKKQKAKTESDLQTKSSELQAIKIKNENAKKGAEVLKLVFTQKNPSLTEVSEVTNKINELSDGKVKEAWDAMMNQGGKGDNTLFNTFMTELAEYIKFNLQQN